MIKSSTYTSFSQCTTPKSIKRNVCQERDVARTNGQHHCVRNMQLPYLGPPTNFFNRFLRLQAGLEILAANSE